MDGDKCLEKGKGSLVPALQQRHTRVTPREEAACGCHTSASKDRANKPVMVLFNLFTYIYIFDLVTVDPPAPAAQISQGISYSFPFKKIQLQ